MQIRHESSRKETAQMNTEELRENFLIESLFVSNKIEWVYTHYDRVLAGGAMPTTTSVSLDTHDALKAEYFLERREIGIINVGGKGSINADGTLFNLEKLGCVYLGKGTKEVTFTSEDPTNPARFFLLSAPAHHSYPNQTFTKEQASPVNLGALETSNQRTIYKYIHLGGIQSCQLVMGLTVLQPGSVWNTMPSHTHDRRMEVYCYFDIPENHGVLHLMGEPTQTRHLWVANHQAIISPPWSIHSGCGTCSYSFIWGMAGENKDFTDMDAVPIPQLR
ncbi:5-dehydro-4-deoxy-D-glucuronate isomerase [Runella zeae]|jgi:4-deoxy-L-threo-5-hexosulose-uronate ketol-isomerase|uniref:5-dehydro-4-deoxy-D-glucuronate isomerase n=1 Tax=Runella zeae TaxID=94255 RepID=UPI0004011EF2|nr:5-dehydro-4-deoxy-D-glucuronate isomerase [Runella zeae]